MIHSSIPFSQVGSPPRIKQPNVILNYSRLRNHESSSVINLSKKVDRGYSHDKQRRIKTIKSTNTHQLIPKLMCKPASQINHNYNAQSLKSRSIEIKRNKSVPILHQNPSMVKLENKYFQTRGTIDNSHNRDIKKRDTKVNIHYNIHASIDTKLEPKVQPKFKSKFDPQAHNAAQSKQELRLSPKIYNKAENRLKFVTNGFQEPKNKWEHACRSREIKISGKQSNQELSLQNKYGKQVINRG